MINLNDDIKFIKGVGEKRAELFRKLGISDIGSLVHYFPRNYQDWSKEMTVADCTDNAEACIKATLITPVYEHRVRKGMILYKCSFTDGETTIKVTIFNNKFLAKSLKEFNDYILFGKITKALTYAEMSSPKIEKAEDNIGIHPIYPATEKLSSKAILNVIKTALDSLPEFAETLPKYIIEKYGLCSLDFAIRQIHFPTDFENLDKARKRLVFEELLILQLGLLKLKSRNREQTDLIITDDFTKEYFSLLPFSPTNAQKNAIADCIADLKKGYPMNRLIQGDVGSGKTAVAGGAVYSAVKNGFQCALMAPTEILAAQHFETLSSLLENTDFRIALITGSTPAKEKRLIKSNLANGEIDLVIGTHALIQNDVEFKNLALVITDEQHRFGVNQRSALSSKGRNVHTIVMSATPIPRTLALMIYGDLDISVLNELPPGRQKIRTDVVNSSYHQRIYKFIRNAVDSGRQAYIVCSLVEEGETDLIPAVQYAEELANTAFRGYNIGILHGKMKAADKEKIMKSFSDGDVKILISTTVVEVGVDVPNATIMVIENAERFGLSQLHQLRGRVGRGTEQSFCILVSDSESEASKERLAIMKKYSDGFKIADEDLKQRGPGDFFGNRQHGLPDLKVADMIGDMETLKLCRKCADEILKKDFNLDLPEHQPILNQINNMFRKTANN